MWLVDATARLLDLSPFTLVCHFLLHAKAKFVKALTWIYSFEEEQLCEAQWLHLLFWRANSVCSAREVLSAVRISHHNRNFHCPKASAQHVMCDAVQSVAASPLRRQEHCWKTWKFMQRTECFKILFFFLFLRTSGWLVCRCHRLLPPHFHINMCAWA